MLALCFSKSVNKNLLVNEGSPEEEVKHFYKLLQYVQCVLDEDKGNVVDESDRISNLWILVDKFDRGI